jgi:hypothetical protein
MYRVLAGHRLSGPHQRIIEAGSIDRLEWLDDNPNGIAALVEKGAIARINPPPLAILPGWKIRSGKVKVSGIEDVEQFLTADDAVLVKCLGIKVETVQRWKQDLIGFLQAPPGKCCGG